MTKFPNTIATSAQLAAVAYVGLWPLWKNVPLNSVRVRTILANAPPPIQTSTK